MGAAAQSQPERPGIASLIVGAASFILLNGLGAGPMLGLTFVINALKRAPRGVALTGIVLNIVNLVLFIALGRSIFNTRLT